jgi:hypothetical protein
MGKRALPGRPTHSYQTVLGNLAFATTQEEIQIPAIHWRRVFANACSWLCSRNRVVHDVGVEAVTLHDQHRTPEARA